MFSWCLSQMIQCSTVSTDAQSVVGSQNVLLDDAVQKHLAMQHPDLSVVGEQHVNATSQHHSELACLAVRLGPHLTVHPTEDVVKQLNIRQRSGGLTDDFRALMQNVEFEGPHHSTDQLGCEVMKNFGDDFHSEDETVCLMECEAVGGELPELGSDDVASVLSEAEHSVSLQSYSTAMSSSEASVEGGYANDVWPDVFYSLSEMSDADTSAGSVPSGLPLYSPSPHYSNFGPQLSSATEPMLSPNYVAGTPVELLLSRSSGPPVQQIHFTPLSLQVHCNVCQMAFLMLNPFFSLFLCPFAVVVLESFLQFAVVD